MIGIFDSGSGGLSVLKVLKEKAPNVDVVYFGDIKHAPYGNRSREELGALTVLDVQKLMDLGASNIISACNSVSANVVLPIADILGISGFNIVEMVQPTALDVHGNQGRPIVVLGTKATIESGIYQQAFKEHGLHVEGIEVPELAGAIEFGSSESVLRAIIDEAVIKALIHKPGVIVLGCTHFPLVYDLFSEYVTLSGSDAVVYDPAVAVVDEAIKRFGTEGQGTTRFVISADSEHFRKRVEQLFGNNFTIEVG